MHGWFLLRKQSNLLPGWEHLFENPWKTIPWEYINYKNKCAEHEHTVHCNYEVKMNEKETRISKNAEEP